MFIIFLIWIILFGILLAFPSGYLLTYLSSLVAMLIGFFMAVITMILVVDGDNAIALGIRLPTIIDWIIINLYLFMVQSIMFSDLGKYTDGKYYNGLYLTLDNKLRFKVILISSILSTIVLFTMAYSLR